MHIHVRSLLIALLALAVFAGSANQTAFLQLHAATPAHDHPAMHNHGVAGEHHHGAPQDQKKQNASLTCCGLCVIASAEAPAAPCTVIELVLSAVFYPPTGNLAAGRTVVLDPGIPKRA